MDNQNQTPQEKFKTLGFIYQENEIHFLLNPDDDHVMINATEMAKLFNKKVDNFMRLDLAQRFINKLFEIEKSRFVPSHVREQITMNDIYYTTNKATFMHRKLALKFAVWLDEDLEQWIIDKIDHILFGNLKDYRDAMKKEIEAKKIRDLLKEKALAEPNSENIKAYFDNEEEIKTAQGIKAKAVRLQKTLFEQDFLNNKITGTQV